MELNEIQNALQQSNLDAWLFYDHHHRDPISYRLLGLSEQLMVTRRWFYMISAKGEPQGIVHRIESHHLDALPGDKWQYSSWPELSSGLKALVSPYKTIAMQYSPNNALPLIGMADAGTIELVRSFGVNVVTSADLVSRFDATLSEEQIASHFAAADAIDRITKAAFEEIGRAVRIGGTNEYKIQQWILEAFRRENIVTEGQPVVAVNANSSDPHYIPSANHFSPICDGDYVLLDIWGRQSHPKACFYDITWTGFVGDSPSDKQCDIFDIVRRARDAGVKIVQEAFAANRKIAGWEVDKAVRNLITESGYGHYFTHRTGHSIGANVHGDGANIDNLETHDEREILPNTCFSIEPGIYLPEFGVRSEVNLLVHGNTPKVTGQIQTEIVLI